MNEVLKLVNQRCKESEEANIQLALLDGLSDLYMNDVTLECVHSLSYIYGWVSRWRSVQVYRFLWRDSSSF